MPLLKICLSIFFVPYWTCHLFEMNIISIAYLRLVSLERTLCKTGPWLASGNLDFRKFPIISRTVKSGSLYLDRLYKHHGLCWTPAFHWQSRILVHAGMKLSSWSATNKNLMSSRGRQYFTRIVIIQCWRNQVHTLLLHWKRTLGNLCQVSYRYYPMCLYPLLIFLYIIWL